MKIPNFTLKRPEKGSLASSLKGRAFRAGGYSLAAAAAVIAIAVIVNMLASSLPSSWTKLDMTASGIYSISGQTQQIVAALTEPVDVYWICQDGEEDPAIEQMLELYEGLSENLTVTQVDPVVYPNFALEYTDEAIYNNSLIVAGESRSRYLSYYDIYTTDYSDYYTTGQVYYEFAGEGLLTSAVNYVVSQDLPVVYTLTGHGESALPTSLQEGAENDNLILEELSLLSLEATPDDADAIIIYSPQSDISESEAELLKDYLAAGGKLLLVTDYIESQLPNLMSVMEYYGTGLVDGIVIEGDASKHIQGLSYYLLPTVRSHDVTAPIYDGGYYILMPIAQGIEISEELRDGLQVTKLLTTSDDAYSKIAGYDLTTYDKEEGDISGPFSLAVAISESTDRGETRIVWLGTSAMFDDTANAAVSGANQDLFLNALGWMCQQEETISIRAKSLDSSYLTVSSADASRWSFILIAFIPLCFIVPGAYTAIKRRRR